MKIRDLISTFIWITGRTLRIAPFWYTGLATSYVAQSLLPVAQTYALAQILGEAVRILGTDTTAFTPDLIWWIIFAL